MTAARTGAVQGSSSYNAFTISSPSPRSAMASALPMNRSPYRVVRLPQPAPEDHILTRGNGSREVVLKEAQPLHDVENRLGRTPVEQLRADRDPARLFTGSVPPRRATLRDPSDRVRRFRRLHW
jgi:hypothetical protein